MPAFPSPKDVLFAQPGNCCGISQIKSARMQRANPTSRTKSALVLLHNERILAPRTQQRVLDSSSEEETRVVFLGSTGVLLSAVLLHCSHGVSTCVSGEGRLVLYGAGCAACRTCTCTVLRVTLTPGTPYHLLRDALRRYSGVGGASSRSKGKIIVELVRTLHRPGMKRFSSRVTTRRNDATLLTTPSTRFVQSMFIFRKQC